jgi:hypothetical protein
MGRSDNVVPTKSIEGHSAQNMQAIRYRLRKAFPEVAKCFPQLGRMLAGGGDWPETLREYLRSLSPRQVERLDLELDDLFAMGWTDADQFELVVTSIFGLPANITPQRQSSQLVSEMGRMVSASR